MFRFFENQGLKRTLIKSYKIQSSRIFDLSNLRSFLRDGFIYTSLSLANKVIPFLLLPILIRLVSPEEYGRYSLFVTLETLLLPIISLNMYAALSKHYYIEGIDLKSYISSMAIISMIFLLGFLLLSFTLPSSLINLSGLPRSLFLLAIINTGMMGIVHILSSLYRLERQPINYGIYVILQSLLLFGFIILFGMIGRSSQMIINGRVFYMLLICLITLFILRYKNLLALIYDKSWIKRIIIFSLPTVLYSLSAFIFSASDRFFIQYYLGIKHVGFYSAIYQLSAVISIAGAAFNAAWLPWLFENLKKNDDDIRLFIVKLSYVLIFGFIMLASLFCLFFPIIANVILTNDFLPYLTISYPIIFSFAFQGIYFIISPYIFYAEKTKYNAIIGILVALINILLNTTLIPYLGLKGAAYSSLITWMSLATMFFYYSNRVYPMPWFFMLKKT